MANKFHQAIANEYGQDFLDDLLNDSGLVFNTTAKEEYFYKVFEDEILETLKEANYKELSFEPLEVIISDRLLRALEA